MAQSDPSHSVPQELMPHVHLVSSYRYPTMPRLDPNEVAKWLMTAPQIARDRAPFFWTYLDKPSDGTILLTWQPLQRLGTNFATDGFVWAPPEQVYKHDLGNGLILEIYFLKAGYIPGEHHALHTRRRFRLIPAPGHPSPPQLDMSLFIVHYGPSEQNDRVPAAMIPYDERVNTIMQQRHYLLRGGQIRRKEFMLSDRVNWPSLPELTRQQMGPQMTPRGVPQQMAYPPQPPAPGPPTKRARHAQNQPQPTAVPGAPPLDVTFDDDEDTSRGDMFDHLTPREISLSRYQQNHEWMEEILSSAYRIGQIQPSDLNLGLKGELASLTEGIFTAQGGDVFTQSPEKPYVGRLDAGLADEFRKRVNKHVESTEAEVQKLKEQHNKLLADFKVTSLVKLKEKEIRSIPDPHAPQVFASEDGAKTGDNEEGKAAASLATRTILEEMWRGVESTTGRKIELQAPVRRVQEGGYQAPMAPRPPSPAPPVMAATTAAATATAAHMSRQPSQAGSQNSGIMMGDSDMDMGGTAAGLLDQMHTSGFSTMSTPVNNFPTPQAQASAGQSNAPTPSQQSHVNDAPSPTVATAVPAPTPVAAAATTTAPASASAAATSEAAAPGPTTTDAQAPDDVDMTGTDGPSSSAKEGAESAPDQGTESGDWVVVPKGGGMSPAAETKPAPAAPSQGASEPQKPNVAAATVSTKPNTSSAAATPAAVTDGGSVTFDQNDFSSLGDLDTAGDAMAEYDAPDLAGSIGDGLDLQMDMDDSAFGDAFHGVDTSGATPGDTQHEM